MTCEQLKDIIKDPSMKLIDVRTPQEFQRARLKGAINLPLTDLHDIHHHATEDETILLYCQSGHRSESAKNFLLDKGFEARNIGGIIHHPQCVEY